MDGVRLRNTVTCDYMKQLVKFSSSIAGKTSNVVKAQKHKLHEVYSIGLSLVLKGWPYFIYVHHEKPIVLVGDSSKLQCRQRCSKYFIKQLKLNYTMQDSDIRDGRENAMHLLVEGAITNFFSFFCKLIFQIVVFHW